MAYSPSEKYPGAVDVDPDYQGGKFRDNNPSTTNNGSPLKAIDRNELLARDEAIMNDAGFEYSGVADTPQDSQLFKAYKASLGNGANLLSNHNFLIQTPDDSQPLPSATPTSYPPGYQIFSGVFANETTGITNLTYIDGRISFSGGDFYFAVPNTGGVERLTSDQLTASVADFDGKPRTRGVSFALVGDEYRVTVGVDALEDVAVSLTSLGSVKFEQGSVATRHSVKSLLDIYGHPDMGIYNPKALGAKADGTSDDLPYLQQAVNMWPEVHLDGKYFCNGPLIIQKSNLRIKGESVSSTEIRFPAGSNGIQMGDGTGQTVRLCAFENLTIRGVKSASGYNTFGITHKDSLDYPGGITPQGPYLCESVSLRNVWCWDFDVGFAHGLGAKIDLTNYQGIGCKRGLWAENAAGLTYRDCTLSANEVGLYMSSCSHVDWCAGECNGNSQIAMNIIGSSGVFTAVGLEINAGQVLRITSPRGIKFIQPALRENAHGSQTAMEVDAGTFDVDHSFTLFGMFFTPDAASTGSLISIDSNINSGLLIDVEQEGYPVINNAKKALSISSGGIEFSTKFDAVKILQDRIVSRIFNFQESSAALATKTPDGSDIGMTQFATDMFVNVVWDGYMWRNSGLTAIGTTSQRPTDPWVDFLYWDTDNGFMIKWDGASWQVA